MRVLIYIFFIFISYKSLFARSEGETEITAEEGIEVFNNEKYYLLKKNVKIENDNFILLADKIKMFFDKDLYDVKIINAYGNVKLDSPLYKLKADSENLSFIVDNEEINLSGDNSKLFTDNIQMFSNGTIQVKNIEGEFYIEGDGSELISENIIIKGNKIDGKFSSETNLREIVFLDIYDDNIAYVNDNNSEMFANLIKYNKKTSLIELEKNVKIINKGEIITGDYGTLDTKSNSYKIQSKDSNKVIAIITDKDE